MCGIAGYSLDSNVELDSSMLTRLFIAGLAERGEDASGYAYRRADGAVEVVKRALPPHEFLATVPIAVPAGTREAIVHVRDHTKGRPSHHGNNHPIRHGAICGVHNGIIQNDDALFAEFGRERALPGMSVDSEAIFMLCDVLEQYGEAFDHLVGSYSTAFFDDRDGEGRSGLHVARGRGRPLLLARGQGITVFASTRHAIEFAVERLGLELSACRSIAPGTLLRLENGQVAVRSRFDVRDFQEAGTARYSHAQANATRARELADQQHQGERAS